MKSSILAALFPFASGNGSYYPSYHDVTAYYWNPEYNQQQSYHFSYRVSYHMGKGYFYDPAYGYANYDTPLSNQH